MNDAPYEINDATWDALVAHSLEDDPFEVCGLLGVGPDGMTRHFRIKNAEPSMYYYSMDGRQLLKSMRVIEDDELEMTIYHSHTHTQAYPSETDVNLAAYPEATYVIVTLQDKDAPDMRAFRILDGQITERPVVRTGSAGGYVRETAHEA